MVSLLIGGFVWVLVIKRLIAIEESEENVETNSNSGKRPPDVPQCPKCNSLMVLRIAKRGEILAINFGVAQDIQDVEG